MPALTIGMAVHSDFDGVAFTLQGLRMYHHLNNVELIVIDNDPESADGKATKGFVEKLTGKWSARYIPFTEVKGTSATRNLVFSEAKNEIVMCIDSHVLLAPGALYYLTRFYDENPGSMDLLQGPLIYEDLLGYSTHFQDIWQAEMWGVWGTDPRGENPENRPFEIPGQGLGLFACRKDAWLGFNPYFKSFGGEEMYIHEKYRIAGRKTWCLPGLRWWHRFTRPRGVNYPLTREDKVRNYLLGHLELNLPLERVYNHFVKDIGMSQETFDILLAEATSFNNELKQKLTVSKEQTMPQDNKAGQKKGCGCGKNAPSGPLDVTQVIQNAAENRKDSGSDLFVQLFKDKENVVEVVERRSRIHALVLNQKPKNFFSIANETLPEQNRVNFDVRGTKVTLYSSIESSKDSLPASADVLIISNPNGLLKTVQELKPTVADVIICSAKEQEIIDFIKLEGTTWSVINDKEGNYVLSKSEKDKKELPSLLSRTASFLKAAFKYARNGFGDAAPDLQNKRYELCLVCPVRSGDHCSECGCPVKEKSSWESETCPKGKW